MLGAGDAIGVGRDDVLVESDFDARGGERGDGRFVAGRTGAGAGAGGAGDTIRGTGDGDGDAGSMSKDSPQASSSTGAGALSNAAEHQVSYPLGQY